jgi:WXG100 family type VII secretion target
MAVDQTRNTAHITNAATTMDSAHDVVKSQLTTVQNLMAQLQPSWSSQSGRSFQQAMVDWGSNGQKLLAAMAEIANLLRTAGSQFTSTDDQLHQDANKFASNVQSYTGLTVRP